MTTGVVVDQRVLVEPLLEEHEATRLLQLLQHVVPEAPRIGPAPRGEDRQLIAQLDFACISRLETHQERRGLDRRHGCEDPAAPTAGTWTHVPDSPDCTIASSMSAVWYPSRKFGLTSEPSAMAVKKSCASMILVSP